MISLFEKGPAYVLDLIREEVVWMFEDFVLSGQGISSSDISVCVRSVCYSLLSNSDDLQHVPAVEIDMIRCAVQSEICNLEEMVAA